MDKRRKVGVAGHGHIHIYISYQGSHEWYMSMGWTSPVLRLVNARVIKLFLDIVLHQNSRCLI